MDAMSDDLLQVLTRFHREVVQPDLNQLLDRVSGVEGSLGTLRDEMLTHFDAIYQRFDRLETESQALVAAVRRLETQVAAMAKVDVRRELDEIKARVAQLQERIEQLEATL